MTWSSDGREGCCLTGRLVGLPPRRGPSYAFFEGVALSKDFQEFLTVPAYERINWSTQFGPVDRQVENLASMRVPALLRELAAGCLAGIIVGIVIGGLGSRLAMRVSAIAAGPIPQGVTTDNGNIVGEITLGGTIALIVFGGVFAGLQGGLLYAALRPWLLPFGPWRGLVFGLGLLGLDGSLILDETNSDFIILRPALLNVAMFAALFPIFGMALAPVFDRVLRFVDRGSVGARMLMILALGLAAVFLGLGLVSGIGALGSNPTPIDLIGLLSLLLVVAGLAARTVKAAVTPPPWSPASYVVLAAAVLIGAARTYSNVARILS